MAPPLSAPAVLAGRTRSGYGNTKSRAASNSGGRAGERPPPRGESRLRNTTDSCRSP